MEAILIVLLMFPFTMVMMNVSAYILELLNRIVIPKIVEPHERKRAEIKRQEKKLEETKALIAAMRQEYRIKKSCS